MAELQQYMIDYQNMMAAIAKYDRKRTIFYNEFEMSNGKNYFNYLPDELIIKIFSFLPVLSLLHCDLVCRRFRCCVRDNCLWHQLNLHGNIIKSGVIEFILQRHTKQLKLHRTIIVDPKFSQNFLHSQPKQFCATLKILELRGVSCTRILIARLLSYCHDLEELTFELMTLDDDICREIGKCIQLKRLTILDCPGIDSWSMLMNLSQLTDLYISSPFFTIETVTMLVLYIPSNILSLKLDGCRESMIDAHLKLLIECCSQLREMSLINCGGITAKAVRIVRKSKNLNIVTFRKCSAVGQSVIMKFFRTDIITKLEINGTLTNEASLFVKRTFQYFGSDLSD